MFHSTQGCSEILTSTGSVMTLLGIWMDWGVTAGTSGHVSIQLFSFWMRLFGGHLGEGAQAPFHTSQAHLSNHTVKNVPASPKVLKCSEKGWCKWNDNIRVYIYILYYIYIIIYYISYLILYYIILYYIILYYIILYHDILTFMAGALETKQAFAKHEAITLWKGSKLWRKTVAKFKSEAVIPSAD